RGRVSLLSDAGAGGILARFRPLEPENRPTHATSGAGGLAPAAADPPRPGPPAHRHLPHDRLAVSVPDRGRRRGLGRPAASRHTPPRAPDPPGMAPPRACDAPGPAPGPSRPAR